MVGDCGGEKAECGGVDGRTGVVGKIGMLILPSHQIVHDLMI